MKTWKNHPQKYCQKRSGRPRQLKTHIAFSMFLYLVQIFRHPVSKYNRRNWMETRKILGLSSSASFVMVIVVVLSSILIACGVAVKDQQGRRNLLNFWNHHWFSWCRTNYGTQQGLSAGAVCSIGIKIRGCQTPVVQPQNPRVPDGMFWNSTGARHLWHSVLTQGLPSHIQVPSGSVHKWCHCFVSWYFTPSFPKLSF